MDFSEIMITDIATVGPGSLEDEDKLVGTIARADIARAIMT